MDVESKCHHCFYPSKYFCSRTSASMCLTLASLFGLFVCNICTCSIRLSAQHAAFLFFFCVLFLFSASVHLRKIQWKLAVGAMLISPTIVWVRKTDCLLWWKCVYTTPCVFLCGHAYVRMCASSSHSLCKCVLHGSLKLLKLSCTRAHMTDHYVKTILLVL